MKQVFQHGPLGSMRNTLLPDVIVHDVFNNCYFLMENMFRYALGRNSAPLYVLVGWLNRNLFFFFLICVRFSKLLSSDKKSCRKDSCFNSVMVRLKIPMHS